MPTDYFSPFPTWDALLTHISANAHLFYWAPLDYRPVLVGAKVLKNGKIRVHPFVRDAYPFVADKGHLDRFRFQLR